MRGPFFCQYGMTVGCTCAGTIGPAGGFGGTPLATGTGPAGAGAGGAGDSDRTTGFTRGFRRFGIFWRISHTRRIPRDTDTSNLASDCAISRIDAPAPRSVSSTSRYGSSSANRRDLGRRPSAIKRASAAAFSVPAMGAFLPPAGGAPVILRAGVGAPGCLFRGNTGRPHERHGRMDRGSRGRCRDVNWARSGDNRRSVRARRGKWCGNSMLHECNLNCRRPATQRAHTGRPLSESA